MVPVGGGACAGTAYSRGADPRRLAVQGRTLSVGGEGRTPKGDVRWAFQCVESGIQRQQRFGNPATSSSRSASRSPSRCGRGGHKRNMIEPEKHQQLEGESQAPSDGGMSRGRQKPCAMRTSPAPACMGASSALWAQRSGAGRTSWTASALQLEAHAPTAGQLRPAAPFLLPTFRPRPRGEKGFIQVHQSPGLPTLRLLPSGKAGTERHRATGAAAVGVRSVWERRTCRSLGPRGQERLLRAGKQAG